MEQFHQLLTTETMISQRVMNEETRIVCIEIRRIQSLQESGGNRECKTMSHHDQYKQLTHAEDPAMAIEDQSWILRQNMPQSHLLVHVQELVQINTSKGELLEGTLLLKIGQLFIIHDYRSVVGEQCPESDQKHK